MVTVGRASREGARTCVQTPRIKITQLSIIQKIYEQETIPEEWRDSVIVPIFKEKGDVHPGVWQLQGHSVDVAHNEGLGEGD